MAYDPYYSKQHGPWSFKYLVGAAFEDYRKAMAQTGGTRPIRGPVLTAWTFLGDFIEDDTTWGARWKELDAKAQQDQEKYGTVTEPTTVEQARLLMRIAIKEGVLAPKAVDTDETASDILSEAAEALNE